MAYERIDGPKGLLYHYTKRENVEPILQDGRIRKFKDRECWFCTSLEISKVCTGRICGVGVIPKIPEWGLGDMESGVPWRSAGGNSETWRRIQPSEDRIQRRFKVL